ncbi:MAG TPA: site-specific integrase [Candidatus Pacearchaeota archaeon]|nr:site-specific integrase [Candidatus Pacearchaeota archaeon]
MKERQGISKRENDSRRASQKYDRIKIKSSGRTIIRRKKRKVGDMEKLLSRSEILAMISKIPAEIARFGKKGLMYRALIALLYLTGARINELLTLKKSQFEFMQYPKTGIKYMVISNIPTLKRKTPLPRTQFMRKDIEEDFINHAKAWMNELTAEDALLFPIKASRAWQIVEKYTGMFDHYFRHVRNGDLVRLYGFNSYWLQRWNGWARITSGENYVHLIAEDLKEMIMGIEKKEENQ